MRHFVSPNILAQNLILALSQTHREASREKKGETKCYIKKVSKKTGNEYWKEIPVKPEDVK